MNTASPQPPVPATPIQSLGLQKRFPLLLEDLGAAELARLHHLLSLREALSGEVLTRFGEPADTLLLLVEGRLSLSMPVHGRMLDVGALEPGGMLGVAAVVEPGPASSTATVRDGARLLCLSHDQLTGLRLHEPRIAGRLLRGLSRTLADWLRAFEGQMAHRTQPGDTGEFVRVARQLLGMKGP